jgi:hypothetical protein
VKCTRRPTLTDATQREIASKRVAGGGPVAYRSAPLTQPGVYNLSTGTAHAADRRERPAREADVRTIDDARDQEGAWRPPT